MHIFANETIHSFKSRKSKDGSTHPEDYKWSSYRAMITLKDDRITERNRTLSYFKNQSVLHYREFVEVIAHKYIVEET